MDETLSFGRFRVSKPRRELWIDGRRVKIGGRAMGVLLALLDRPGELVTKDELIAAVWAGAVVEDNTIAAQVAAVRRVLGCGVDGAQFVQTVSGRGYCFVAPVSIDPAASKPDERLQETWPGLSTVRASTLWASAAGGLILLVGVGVMVWRLAPRAWTLDRLEMIPTAQTVATDAAPAPDGSIIAYAAGPERWSRHIFLKKLSGGEPLAFTAGDGDDSAPAWSRDGGRIAFVRTHGGRPCEILVKPVLAGSEKRVGRCRFVPRTRLEWSADGDALFFSDRSAPDGAKRIVRLDLNTGRPLDITRPPDGSDGDHEPALSPSGRRIVFQRDTSLLDVLVVHDISTGAERVISSPRVNLGATGAWIDEESIVTATMRPSPSALWVYPADGAPPHVLTYNTAEFYQLAGNTAGLFGFESESYRYDLAYAAAGEAGSPEAIESSSGLVNGLSFSRNGVLAYAASSGGNGPFDVWIKRPGRPAEQLTHLRAAYLAAPRWSPDGREIAFEAVDALNGVRNSLYVVREDGSSLRLLPGSGAWVGSPAWSADGRGLIFVKLVNGVCSLWRIDLDAPSRARPLGFDGWVRVVASGDDLYALRSKGGGIWRLGPKPRLIEAHVNDQHIMDWDVTAGRLVYIDWFERGAPRLVVRSLSGGASRIYQVPQPQVQEDTGGAGVIGGASVDPRTRRPVYVHAAADLAQVGILRLKRR